MDYRVTIECEDNAAKIKLAGIRYEYNVSYQREPEKYTAEEWITDKYALNKKKDKLNRGNGKFRRKTVDFAENMFQSADAAFGIQPAGTVTPAYAPYPCNSGTTAATNSQTGSSCPANRTGPRRQQHRGMPGLSAFEPDKKSRLPY